jgi:hypothetical protein
MSTIDRTGTGSRQAADMCRVSIASFRSSAIAAGKADEKAVAA